MHASLATVGITFAAVFIGCSQSDSPTGLSSNPLRGPSITPVGANAISPSIAGAVVPFRGRLQGPFTVTFDPPPSPFFSVLLDATGNASILGRFTMDAPHRVDTRTGGAIGSFVFTAANGDLLTADFTGASSPTATPNVFAIVETATITGGTGRFRDATGGFVMKRLVDLGTLLATGSFEGTISSPGAGKR